MRRVLRMLTVVVLAGAVVSACFGGTSGDGSGGPTLSLGQALKRVAANDETRATLFYGRPSAVSAANGGHGATGAYGPIIGAGDPVAGLAPLISQTPRLDVRHADSAITAGQPPNAATWLSGADATRFADAAVALGAKRTTSGSSAGYRFREECLGDPLAAQLLNPHAAGITLPADVEAFGVGVSGAAGKTPPETLCVATVSDAAASPILDRIKQNASHILPRSHQKWSDVLSDMKASSLGGPAHIVRLTASPVGGSTGVLFAAVADRDISSLLQP